MIKVKWRHGMTMYSNQSTVDGCPWVRLGVRCCLLFLQEIEVTAFSRSIPEVSDPLHGDLFFVTQDLSIFVAALFQDV